MKKNLIVIFMAFLPFFSFAGSWDQDPWKILSDMKSDDVQDTAIQKTVDWRWNGVKNTLENVKTGSMWYVQWLAFIWLSAAFLLIIYNWIIVLGNFWDENKLAKSKKRFMSLLIWVVLVVGASSVIYFVVSIVAGVFK